MSDICPTITAYTAEEYRQQIECVAGFSKRIHIDYMDGIFAETTSVTVADSWWPKQLRADLHVMHKEPMLVIDDIVGKHPHLVIVHDEAEHVSSFVHELHEHRIKVGIALLHDTSVDMLSHYINVIDHVLVFSGNLGHHGGTADLQLLDKVRAIKEMKPAIEIGWDGGINAENILALRDAGVSVFNVGSYIQHSENPESAYHLLRELVQS